ncbi:MAG: hypothetical protein PVG66_03265 [Chromatiales bacterium]|jgi:hypothetical protein
MKTFVPCQGKTACRDNGEICLTCGRSLVEIARLRDLMDQLATLAIDFEYSNTDDYADYIQRKLAKTIAYRQQQLREQSLVESD